MRSNEFYIKPAPGECTTATVPLPQPQSAVISGTVADDSGPVEGALVLLLEQETRNIHAYTVSDADGRFWFGPLSGEQLYCLRVQKLDGRNRTVEL